MTYLLHLPACQHSKVSPNGLNSLNAPQARNYIIGQIQQQFELRSHMGMYMKRKGESTPSHFLFLFQINMVQYTLTTFVSERDRMVVLSRMQVNCTFLHSQQSTQNFSDKTFVDFCIQNTLPLQLFISAQYVALTKMCLSIKKYLRYLYFLKEKSTLKHQGLPFYDISQQFCEIGSKNITGNSLTLIFSYPLHLAF